MLRFTLHPPHKNSPPKGLLTNGQCTHGSCKDTGSEGQGRCAGSAPFRAGGRSAERGARVPRLSCSPLNQRTRAVPVLRNVRGRLGLRPSPQSAPPCRLPPTSRERRVDGRRRRGGDLSVFHRMTGRRTWRNASPGTVPPCHAEPSDLRRSHYDPVLPVTL